VTYGAIALETDPCTREGELLEEMDTLEYEAGLLYFEEENFGNERP
jgi:hypothetical protein